MQCITDMLYYCIMQNVKNFMKENKARHLVERSGKASVRRWYLHKDLKEVAA